MRKCALGSYSAGVGQVSSSFATAVDITKDCTCRVAVAASLMAHSFGTTIGGGCCYLVYGGCVPV